MSDAGGLQLLPSQKKSLNLHLPGNSRLLLLAVALLVVLGAAYGIATAMNSRTTDKITAAEQQISAVLKQRNKADEEKLLNVQKQLAATRSLLKSHTQWSASFVGIQNLIEPSMKFLSLQVDAEKRTYSFHALAASYTAVAKQVAALYGSPLVKDVRVSKISVTPDGQVDVTMELVLAPHE
ncbi:MAG: hypothetical protein AAB483_03700 [Patescibacteria group bacterium]